MYDFDKKVLGKKLAFAKLDHRTEQFVLGFEDGTEKRYGVYGDCCSTSWIEHLELPHDVAGATLLNIVDSGTITSDHTDHDDEYGQEDIKVYNTCFRTDRGDIVLEFRNASNGYYGGSLYECV